ncbi:hypothetical protein MMC30_006513 [Trapelia coarctata]|nr:hypothetical protein [Trapelia coarctata]
MLENVQLPGFPSSTNCLAWSEDGELAIAAGEYVHILIPNRSRKRDIFQSNSVGPWIQVRVRTNLFTFDEWPTQDPASIEELSLGEEQSTSHAVALAWSPPGLAKHKRSVLAVLTSNLILSLWDPGPNPTEISSWRRAVIVNDCLEEYFKGLKAGESTLRSRKRIRCMGWADAAFDGLKQKQSLGFVLTVINDYKEVVFLTLTTSSQLKGGSVKVLGHHQHVQDDTKTRQRGYEVSWSSWISSENAIQAVLSCTIGGSLLAIRLHVKPSQELDLADGNEAAYQHPGVEVLVEVVSHDGDDFASSRKPLLLGDANKHLRSPQWDVVSGLCYLDDLCYIATHLSHMEVFRIFYDHLSPCKESSNLQMKLSECRQQFMSEHKLNKMATMKTWGLASFQSYIASCITLHPSNMIEYNIPTSEKATIVFSHVSMEDVPMEQFNDQNLRFPWEMAPQIKHLSEVYSATWDTVFVHVNRKQPPKNFWNCRIVYSSYCASRIWRQYEPEDLEAVRALLGTWARSIARLNLGQGAILDGTIGIESLNRQEFVEAANSIIRARSTVDVGTSSQFLLEYCQIAGCFEPLLWTEDLYKTRCDDGHVWNRCALTFFAIQEPGISRYCDSCGREYLHEDYALNDNARHVGNQPPGTDAMEIFDDVHVAENELSTEDESILQTLFNEHEVCIFCGGKFVG